MCQRTSLSGGLNDDDDETGDEEMSLEANTRKSVNLLAAQAMGMGADSFKFEVWISRGGRYIR